MPRVYPGTAAPVASTAEAPALKVDGRTHWVCTTPELLPPHFARPLTGEQVRLAFVASPTTEAPPIHSTLDGIAQYTGAGLYVRGFFARDLALRLAPYAGAVVWVRVSCPPYGAQFLPYRVVLTADTPFLPAPAT